VKAEKGFGGPSTARVNRPAFLKSMRQGGIRANKESPDHVSNPSEREKKWEERMQAARGGRRSRLLDVLKQYSKREQLARLPLKDLVKMEKKTNHGVEKGRTNRDQSTSCGKGGVCRKKDQQRRWLRFGDSKRCLSTHFDARARDRYV